MKILLQLCVCIWIAQPLLTATQTNDTIHVIFADSSEGHLPPHIYKLSETIMNLMEDLKLPQGTKTTPIHLPHINPEQVTLLKYLHPAIVKNYPFASSRRPEDAEKKALDQKALQKNLEENLYSALTRKQLKVQNMVSIIEASNYLDIAPLLNGAINALARYLIIPENLQLILYNAKHRATLKQALNIPRELELELAQAMVKSSGALVLSILFGAQPNIINNTRLITELMWNLHNPYLGARTLNGGVQIYNVTNPNVPEAMLDPDAIRALVPGMVLGGGYGSTGITWTPDDLFNFSSTPDTSLGILDINPLTGAIAQTGHTNAVTSIASSPDNNYLATGSKDHTIRIWSANAPILLQDNAEIISLAWSRDSKYLSASSNAGTIKIWRVLDTQLVHTINAHPGANGLITALIWSQNVLISSSWDGSIKIWNPHNGTLIRTLSNSNGRVNALSLNSDGNYLACALENGTIQIWDITTYALLTSHRMNGPILSVAWSSDNSVLACGLDQGPGSIILWKRVNPGSLLRDLSFEQACIVVKAYQAKLQNTPLVLNGKLGPEFLDAYNSFDQQIKDCLAPYVIPIAP